MQNNSFRHYLLTTACLLAVSGASFPAFATPDAAAGAAASDPSSNIFSTPDSKREPTFSEDQSSGSRMHKALHGRGKGQLPSLQQVKNIPSLSPEQRKTLIGIYKGSRAKAGPLIEQMKAMKEQFGGDRKKAMADPKNREQFKSIRTQLLSIRENTWQQVKACLSEQQMQELASMKKGEMIPATFNEPQSGFPRNRRQMRRQADPNEQTETRMTNAPEPAPQ